MTTTAIVAIVAAAPVCASDDAGSGTEQRLLACEEISDPTGKLACFNAVVESLKQTSAESVPDSPTAAGPDPLSVSGTDRDAAHDSSPDDAVEAATVRPDDGEKEQEDETIQARVVRSWQNLDGRFSVELDNGQVWRETQGTRVGLPAEGDSVEISKGFLGGYRMKIESITPVAWVRRTQ